MCCRRLAAEKRKERQEKRDRKDLVERLLAEHEQNERAAAEKAAQDAREEAARYALMLVSFFSMGDA